MIPLEILASLPADDTAIVLAVVGARLVVPLFIPRFPLIIVVALVLDAADQTIFQEFTGFESSPLHVTSLRDFVDRVQERRP